MKADIFSKCRRRQQHVSMKNIFALLLLLLIQISHSVSRTSSSSSSSSSSLPRKSSSAYKDLATYLSESNSNANADLDFSTYPITGPSSITSTLTDLSKAQSTLKAMDGASHELYQRSHSASSTSVVDEHSESSGRAERSAHRVGCTADALLGCELLDWLEEDVNENVVGEDGSGNEEEDEDEDEEGTLAMNDRKVVFRTFLPGDTTEDDIPMHVVILYEENYNGGGGMHHGGIDGLTSTPTPTLTSTSTSASSAATENKKPRGRFLILLRDGCAENLGQTLHCLDTKPAFLELDVGLVSGEIASVNHPLWTKAEEVLEACKHVLRSKEKQAKKEDDDDEEEDDEGDIEQGKEDETDHDQEGSAKILKKEQAEEEDSIVANPDTLPAIHFVGRSLAGGVASLAAAMLDGSIPLPSDVKKAKGKRKGERKRGGKRRRSGGGDHDEDHTGGGARRQNQRRRKRSSPRTTSTADDVGGVDNVHHNEYDNEKENEHGLDVHDEDISISTSTSSSKRRRRRSKQGHQGIHNHHDSAQDDDGEEGDNTPSSIPPTSSSSTSESPSLHGLGRGRTSAVTLGAPPSISANIKASYITSVILGDDIICRSTYHSLTNLRKRAKRRLDGNLITKKVGWMTDAVSLTVSSIQSHAHGSEGEEERLSIPGNVYLVRPRRLGASSMHEIGTGRDALRAAILWQLNDVLLSRSLWKHHLLESYIRGLDKVKLRGVADGDDNEDDGNDNGGGVYDGHRGWEEEMQKHYVQEEDTGVLSSEENEGSEAEEVATIA